MLVAEYTVKKARVHEEFFEGRNSWISMNCLKERTHCWKQMFCARSSHFLAAASPIFNRKHVFRCIMQKVATSSREGTYFMCIVQKLAPRLSSIGLWLSHKSRVKFTKSLIHCKAMFLNGRRVDALDYFTSMWFLCNKRKHYYLLPIRQYHQDLLTYWTQWSII